MRVGELAPVALTLSSDESGVTLSTPVKLLLDLGLVRQAGGRLWLTERGKRALIATATRMQGAGP